MTQHRKMIRRVSPKLDSASGAQPGSLGPERTRLSRAIKKRAKNAEEKTFQADIADALDPYAEDLDPRILDQHQYEGERCIRCNVNYLDAGIIDQRECTPWGDRVLIEHTTGGVSWLTDPPTPSTRR